jgi:diguanylate cyclase (GGDEF)-like protein
MTFDVRPFWVIGALCATGFGLLVLLLRRGYPDYLNRVLLFLGVANVCLGASFVARLARAWDGDFGFHVLSCTLVVACLSLEYKAMCELKKQPLLTAWLIGPPILMFAIGILFTFVLRNITIEILNFNFIKTGMMILIARILTRKEDGRRRFVDLLMAISYIMLSVVALAAIADGFRVMDFSPEYDFDSLRSVLSCVANIVTLGVAFPLFLLMVSERLNGDLVIRAMRDPLTGLYNRRAFEEIAFREMSGTARTGMPFSVLIFDLNRFKHVNDRFGHAAGDAVLCDAANRLRDSLRDEDYLSRWGGDEFCALLPRATEEQARYVAERVLQAFDNLVFSVGGKAMKISVSIGAATHAGEGRDFQALVKLADDAMYRAKKTSRRGSAFAQNGGPD